MGKKHPLQDITNKKQDSFYSIFDDPEIFECFTAVTDTDCFELVKENDCFLNLPDIEIDENPLNIASIQE